MVRNSKWQEYIEAINENKYIVSQIDFSRIAPAPFLEEHLKRVSENMSLYSRLEETMKPLREFQQNMENLTKVLNLNKDGD